MNFKLSLSDSKKKKKSAYISYRIILNLQISLGRNDDTESSKLRT